MYYQMLEHEAAKKAHEELCEKLKNHTIMTVVLGPWEKDKPAPVGVSLYINDSGMVAACIDVMMLHHVVLTEAAKSKDRKDQPN